MRLVYKETTLQRIDAAVREAVKARKVPNLILLSPEVYEAFCKESTERVRYYVLPAGSAHAHTLPVSIIANRRCFSNVPDILVECDKPLLDQIMEQLTEADERCRNVDHIEVTQKERDILKWQTDYTLKVLSFSSVCSVAGVPLKVKG